MKTKVFLIFVMLVFLCGCTTAQNSNSESDIPRLVGVEQTKSPELESSNQEEIVPMDSVTFYGETWQEAYRQIVCEDPAISLRGKPDTQEMALTPWEIYLGIHDFDGNGIPELILGDGWSAAVFTFSEGKTQRLANLDYPEREFCINGLHLRENGLLAACSGAGGMYGACFSMSNGEVQLAHFVWYPPFQQEIEINGVEETWETLCSIYPLDREDYKGWHERYGLRKEPSGWVLTVYNGETKIENGFIVRAGGDEILLDAEFDFSQFHW